MEKLTDFSYLKKITAGKNDKFEFFTSKFMTSVEPELKNLQNSLQQRDYAQIKYIAHSLKAQYISVGAKKVEELIVRIEEHSSSSILHDLLSVEINQLQLMTEQIINEITIELSTLKNTSAIS